MKKPSLITFVGSFMIPFFILIMGCGGNKIAREDQAMAELMKPVVYEKTGTTERPEWTDRITFYEDDAGFHFTGGVMGGADYALTLRLAKSEAVKNLLESLEIKARSEFSSVMHGNYTRGEKIGRYVTDAVAWTVENLRISGIREKEIYYEEVFDPMTRRASYNAWVSLEIGRDEYIKAKTSAAEKLLRQAVRDGNEEAKKKALELLEKLRHEA